ncbi:unnamed protein product [Polarella glacialis]|uniref:Uncharacterized protein n=1 Tax=Polarella glacialis TaxID=89957 RepID=A0A813I382_POLGL|nr:unnamed protein product [Polarella glacialis]
MAANSTGEFEELDPMQVWVQVALGSILELASCLPQDRQSGAGAFERLLARATKTFSAVAPLSLFSAGNMSKLVVVETSASLNELVATMPELKPAALELLLVLVTATGSTRLVAQALSWLLSGDDDEELSARAAARCQESLQSLWQLGSAIHFCSSKVDEDNRTEKKNEQVTWKFLNLKSCGRPASISRRIRSHRSVSLEESLPASGVYWEVSVNALDRKEMVLGVWLESKKKAVGCRLSNGSAATPGAEAVPAEPLPEVRAGSVFGVLAKAEELVFTCDGSHFCTVMYKKLITAGERMAVLVEQGQGSQILINIGQEPFKRLPEFASRPVPWGQACDPQTTDPYKAFSAPPQTMADAANVLLSLTERNLGRLGSGAEHSAPVHHAFAKCEQMNITEDGTVVNNTRENSWARVDCEITLGVSVEFTFEVLDDRENDEGTCYGIATAECAKYDARGSFVIRGYSGHLYCDGSDKGEKFSKVHPRSRISFRVDYSEGRVEAWLDDQEPRLLVSDPSLFVGRTFFPTVFNYHGTRTRVKLLRCCSGLRGRAVPKDSFALEVSAPAVELWLSVLERLLAPVRLAGGSSAIDSAYGGPVATVLKVLLATALGASASPQGAWAEFGSVQKRITAAIEFILIERRDDPALRLAQDICILLISALGVGAIFGGPEEALKVFLSVRESQAKLLSARGGLSCRLGRSLVAYLLGTRRQARLAQHFVDGLGRLAMTDKLGCQVFLRLALNAFAAGAEEMKGIACSALTLAGNWKQIGEEVALESCCFTELLPVLAQLLSALPKREPDALPAMLEMVGPAAAACATLRKLHGLQGTTPSAGSQPLPRHLADSLEGLNSFLCGVARLLMAPSQEAQAFPLDIGSADLRATATTCLPAQLAAAELAIEELTGPSDLSDTVFSLPEPPLPEVVAEILSGTGRGEALVCELHGRGSLAVSSSLSPPSHRSLMPLSSSPSSPSSSPMDRRSVGPVQRAAFAAAVLCGGPDAWEAAAEDPSAASSAACWRAAEAFVNLRVRPAKQAIAAEHGDVASFEAEVADQIAWLVKHVLWSDHLAASSLPQSARLLGRAVTAPTRAAEAMVRRKLLIDPLPQPSCSPSTSASSGTRGNDAEGMRPRLGSTESMYLDLSKDFSEGSGHALSGAQLQVLALTAAAYSEASEAASDRPLQAAAARTGGQGAGVNSLIAAAASQRHCAVGRRLGLRLLRFLVRRAAESEGLVMMLPALQAALEPTLLQPLLGVAQAGSSWRRSVLAELAGVLRDVHGASGGRRAESSGASEVAEALSLSFLCLPLPRADLEPIFGSLLGGLPVLALGASQGLGQCCARAALLVLRAYLGGQGRGGPALAALLGQVASLLDASVAKLLKAEDSTGTQPLQPPFPLASSITEPLEIDWDFGPFGRLCPRALDISAIQKMLCLEASPEEANLDEHLFSLSLREIRRLRASGVLHAGAASSLLLRLPQVCKAGSKAEDGISVDPLEAAQVFRAGKGEQSQPLPHSGSSGSCVAALTLLRPVADLLLSEVPGIAEKLLRVADQNFGLPACLAICLYFRLPLADEQVASHAPRLLSMLGEAERLAQLQPGQPTLVPQGRGCRRGALAFSSLLSTQLASRSSALAAAVHGSITDFGEAAKAALRLIGGPMCCAACHMQILGTLSGRSMVVGTDARQVAVLALDGPSDAPAVQWVPWSVLQGPVSNTSRGAIWGENIVGTLQKFVRQQLAGEREIPKSSSWQKRSMPRSDSSANSGLSDECFAQPIKHQQQQQQQWVPSLDLLRALAAVLPSSPCWDMSIVSDVVRELDELAATGVNDLSSGLHIEFIEHRCALLRLALLDAEPQLEPTLEDSGNGKASTCDLDGAASNSVTLPEAAASCVSNLGYDASSVPSVSSSDATLSVPEALSQGAEWRGRYKLKRHTNTWYKAKWHMHMNLAFHPDGGLDVTVRWPKFPQPVSGRNARWNQSDESVRGSLSSNCGVSVVFEAELPAGRREGGRTRDLEVFTWRGHLHFSRGCPHLQGTATCQSSELVYEWYVVPPDPLALFRASSSLDIFGRPEEALLQPFSLMSFNSGFLGQKTEHFRSSLGLVNDDEKLDNAVLQDICGSGVSQSKGCGDKAQWPARGTPHDLAVAAVHGLKRYTHVHGPPEVTTVAKSVATSEESFGLREFTPEASVDASAVDPSSTSSGALGPGVGGAAAGVAGAAPGNARWCPLSDVLPRAAEEECGQAPPEEEPVPREEQHQQQQTERSSLISRPTGVSVTPSSSMSVGAGVWTPWPSRLTRIVEGVRAGRPLLPAPLPPRRPVTPLATVVASAASRSLGRGGTAGRSSIASIVIARRSASALGREDEREDERSGSSPASSPEEAALQKQMHLQSLATALEQEERQLRHAVLMNLLQVMLAHRPPEAPITECFREPAQREAFLRRALRLPDTETMLARFSTDFASSPELAASALTVAVEGLLSPFMAGQLSSVTVETDHQYHPNEDWAFLLQIPGASRMKVKFDCRSRTECGRDFLQFFEERDTSSGVFSKRLHCEEKLSGCYPGVFSDITVPGDKVWMRFQSDGSEQYWGLRFTLTGEGRCASASAVPFPAALRLLLATVAALPDTEQHCARILGASLLLGVSAAQPLSDEATKAVEGLCELLPEPCQWSWQSWRAALNLMGVAERAGRRQLLALLATLLSAQMGPQNALAAPGEHEPSATGVSMPPLLVLDKVRPVCAGVLLNGQATVMASSVNKALAMGPPLPSPPAFGLARAAGGCTTIAAAASAAAVLFCVRLEAGLGLASTSTEGCSFGVGLALVSGSEEAGAHGEDSPVCCDVTALALPGEELAVEVQREAAELLLVVRGRLGSVRQELDRSWASAVAVRPVLWVQGFGAAATLQAPASTASWRDAQQAAGRLLQLQRAQQLVEVCGEGGDELFGCEKTSSGRKGSERSKSPGDVFKASISALKANSDVKKNTPDISEKQGAESVNKSERRILPGLLVAKAWARQERALAHGSTGQGASVDEAAAAAEAKDEQAAVTEELRTQCVALADRSSTDIGVAGFCFSNVRELQDSDSAPSPPESRNLELRLAPQLLQVPGASALELRCKHLELPEGLQLRVTHDRLGELPVMRPLAPGSVGDGGRQHAVEFGKYLFATLDDADPASLEKSAQGGWLQVPQGWELVQSQAEVIPEVIATHCWGTEAMVLGSGDAFYTKGHEQASKAGQCLGKDKLSSREGPDGRMQYQPVRCLAPARILVRRLRPGSVGSASAPGRTEPLLLEDLALGETMLVPGSAVYVHGPGTKAPFWAAVPSAVGSEWEHSGSGGDGEAAAFSGTPQASFASSGMAVSPKRSQQDASYESYGLSLVRPQFRQLRSPQQPDSELTLCSGPWQWALSPHHRVMLVLVPDGSVRLSETTLDAMTPAELEEARQSVRVCGEGVVQPGSGWIDPAKFRLARVSGCWDCGSAGRGEGGAGAVLPKLRIELEGADDLGTASLTFEAVPGQGNPVEVRDSWLVVVSGQVSHLRWGSHAVISGGRLWLPGEVISAWPRPRSSKAAVEVQLMGITDPPAATEVRVLTADEFACDSFSNKRDSNDIPVGCDSPAGHSSTSSKPHDPSRDPSVRRSLLLAEGEYLQRVCGEGNLDGEGSMPLRLEICTNRGRRIAWPPFARNDRPFELAAPDFCEVLGFAPQVLEQHAGALGSAAGSSASGAPASSGLAGESRSAASHSSVSAQSASSAVRGKQDLLFRPLSLGRGPAFSLRRLPLDEAAYWEGFLHLGRTAVTLRCHLTALGASGTAGTGSDHLSRSFSALLIEEASSLGDGVVSTTTRVVGVLTCGEVSSSGAVRATLAGELPGLERCQQLEGRCMVDCSDPTVLASMVLVSGQLGNDSPQQVVPAGQPQQRQSQAPIRLVLRCRALEGPATTPALPAAVPEHRALNVHGRNLVFRGESHHPEKSNGSYISASSQIRDPAEPLGPVISRFLLHSAQAVWSRQLCTGGCSRQQEGDIVRVAEMLVQQLNSSGRAGGSNVVGEESESGSSGLFIGLAPRKLGSADADAGAQRILQAEPMLCWPGLGSAVSWLWRSDGSIAHPLVGQQHSPLWRFGAGDRVGFAIEAQQVSFLRNGQRVHSAPRAPSSPGSGSGSGSGSEADPLPTLLVGLQRDAVLQLGGEVQHPQLLLDRLDREGDCLRRRWHHRCGDCLIPCSCRSRRCTSRSVPHASDGSSLWSPGSSATPSCGSGCSCGPGMTCHCHLSSRTVERKGKSSSSSRQEERSSGSFEGGPLEGVAQPGRADLGGWESERGKVGGPGMSRIPEAAANFHKGFTGDDRGGVRRRFRRCVHALVWLTKLVRRTFKGPASWRPCLDYFGSEGGFAERGLTLDGPVLLTSSSHSPSSDAGQLWVETSADGTAGRLARDLQENQDRGIGFVPPGCEITALKEVDGWLEVLRSPAAAAVDGCRSAWFPVEEVFESIACSFVARAAKIWVQSCGQRGSDFDMFQLWHRWLCPDLGVWEMSCFMAAQKPLGATTLPSGAEPFTVEALVQIPVEDSFLTSLLSVLCWRHKEMRCKAVAQVARGGALVDDELTGSATYCLETCIRKIRSLQYNWCQWALVHQQHATSFCSDLQDCLDRSESAHGSTDGEPHSRNLRDHGPYFSTDPKENPLLHDFNWVFVRYCDGGYFSGDVEHPVTVTSREGNKKEKTELYFRGRYIREAVVDYLKRNHGMHTASDVILAGCSSGAITTMFTMNVWRRLLDWVPRFSAFADSGFFLDEKGYSKGKNFILKHQNASASLEPRCVERHQEKPWECFVAANTIPYAEAPLFVWQSRYDTNQLGGRCEHSACKNAFGKRLEASIKLVLTWHGYFIDACSRHCWGKPQILGSKGKTPLHALHQWYQGGLVHIIQSGSYPCESCCSDASEVIFEGGRGHVPMEVIFD